MWLCLTGSAVQEGLLSPSNIPKTFPVMLTRVFCFPAAANIWAFFGTGKDKGVRTEDLESRCKELIQMCLSMMSCHPQPTFLVKRHPSRNTVVLIALAGYSQIKLRSSVGGNRSLQCFWMNSDSREQDGASLSRYAPRMSVWILQWCQEQPQPHGLNAASEGPAGAPGKAKSLFPGEQRRGEHAPCRNSP